MCGGGYGGLVRGVVVTGVGFGWQYLGGEALTSLSQLGLLKILLTSLRVFLSNSGGLAARLPVFKLQELCGSWRTSLHELAPGEPGHGPGRGFF